MSVAYSPLPPHADDGKAAAQYTYGELLDLAKALDAPQPFLLLQVLYVEPDKPRDGMVAVAAGGLFWNPGGTGAGIYARIGGAWVKL